jgi:hypothetical protein
VLAHGYLLNHTALSIHRLHSLPGGIGQLVQLLHQLGQRLNTDGGQQPLRQQRLEALALLALPCPLLAGSAAVANQARRKPTPGHTAPP